MEDCRISIIAGQPSRPTEREPVLMAVQFPYDLVVTKHGVQVGDARPERHGSTTVVHRIEMPIYNAGPIGPGHVAVGENVVAAFNQTVGPVTCIVGCSVKMLE